MIGKILSETLFSCHPNIFSALVTIFIFVFIGIAIGLLMARNMGWFK